MTRVAKQITNVVKNLFCLQMFSHIELNLFIFAKQITNVVKNLLCLQMFSHIELNLFIFTILILFYMI